MLTGDRWRFYNVTAFTPGEWMSQVVEIAALIDAHQVRPHTNFLGMTFSTCLEGQSCDRELTASDPERANRLRDARYKYKSKLELFVSCSSYLGLRR